MNRLSLRRNFFWTSVGTIAKAVALWLQIVIIGRYLGAEKLGQFSLAVAISMPIYTLFGMSLGRVMVVDTDDQHTFSEYFGVRIFLNIFAALILLGISIAQQYEGVMLFTLAGVVLWHGLEMSFILTSSHFQKHENMNFLGKSRLMYSAILVGGLAVGLIVTKTIFGGLVVICFLSFLLLLLYDLNRVKLFTPVMPVFSPQLLNQILRKCWLISLASGATILAGHIPSYLIKASIGTKEIGYFVAANLTSVGVVVVVIALAQSALRRLAVLFREDLMKFRVLLLKLSLIAFGFSAVNVLFSIFLGEKFLSTIFSEEYSRYSQVMVVMSVSGIFTSLIAILGDTIIATRQYFWRLFAAVSSILTIVVFSRILVPGHGLNGIAYSCLCGSFVGYVACIVALVGIIVNEKRRGRPDKKSHI